MTEAELMQLLAAITPPDDTACAAAHRHGNFTGTAERLIRRKF